MNQFSSQQRAQEVEYAYPYHYIPDYSNNGFSQVQCWSWGMNYLGGIELVLSRLNEIKFSSLLDIGCGDGRFLREVVKRYPDVEVLGVDYSQTAINLAAAMNPDVEYKCIDLSKDPLPSKYDVVTMIEVLEHIPPADIREFLEAVRASMSPEGVMVLTVPHVNKEVIDKHYQHFSVRTLETVLRKTFTVESIVPFDRMSRINGRLLRLMGFKGGGYLITSKVINRWMYSRILKGCLNEQPEGKCGRLLAIAKPK